MSLPCLLTCCCRHGDNGDDDDDDDDDDDSAPPLRDYYLSPQTLSQDPKHVPQFTTTIIGVAQEDEEENRWVMM